MPGRLATRFAFISLAACFCALSVLYTNTADAGPCIWRPDPCPGGACETFTDPNPYLEQLFQEIFEGFDSCPDGFPVEPPSTFEIGPRGTTTLMPGVGFGFEVGPTCLANATPEVIPIRCRAEAKYFHASGVLCARINRGAVVWDHRECITDQEFTIRLSRVDGTSQSSTLITSVEPHKTTETLVAKVFNPENGNLVLGIDVRLKLDVIANSGGHNHHDDDRPKGKLSSSSGELSEEDTVLTGNTGASGLQFTFKAVPPEMGDRMPAGEHTLTASCTDRNCMPDGPTGIDVEIEGLIRLLPSETYVLIGSRPAHLNNHFLTTQAGLRIVRLSALYKDKFSPPILHLNDGSLIKGGLFDVGSTAWKPPHFEHCRGTEIDIRANDEAGAIPSTPKHQKEFKHLAAVVGADAIFEIPRDKDGNLRHDLRHFHVRLMGEKPQCR